MIVRSIPRWGSHHETAQSVFAIHQCFLVSSTRGIIGGFLLLHLTECLCILFEIGLSWVVTIPSIMTFLYTVAASDVIQIYPGPLLLLFSAALVVPSFTGLCKHELVADPV